MKYEVEQKYRVADFEAVRQKLIALGAAQQPAITQVDTYYNHPSRDFAETDEALRIRSVGEQNFVTYKGPKIDAETKTRREIELPITPGTESQTQFAELLDALSFVRVASVRKTRTPWTLSWQDASQCGPQDWPQAWPVEAVFDQVDGLGPFVELELISDSARLDDARSALAALETQLELTQVERRSYLEMLLEQNKLS